MKKRKIALTVFIAVCIMAFTASAIETAGKDNHLAALLSSALDLAFETDNVTLSAEAKFSLDGEWFKTFNGTLKQDGYDSYMNVSLDTPKAGGKVYTGGYTVIGQGDSAYSIETYNGPYFVEFTIRPSNTVIRETALTRAAALFADQFAKLLGAGMEEFITVSADSGIQTYKVSMSGDRTPALLNAAVNLASATYAGSFFPGYTGTLAVNGEYEDWDALFAYYYNREIGKAMPEGFLADAMAGNEASMKVYEQISKVMQDEYKEAVSNHTGGVVYFRADGSSEWFAEYTGYMRAAGIINVNYEDSGLAFRQYYQKKTGGELTAIDLEVIQNSSNEALKKAYSDMWNEMDAYYRDIAKADPDTVTIRVDSTGGYTLADSAEDPYGSTVTRRIVSTLDKLALKSAVCGIVLDDNQRFLSASGDIAFDVTDNTGAAHTLDVSFDLSASGYGETSVAAFDPADYGAVSSDEYWAAKSQPYEEPAAYPDTVMFNGTEYLSMIYRY